MNKLFTHIKKTLGQRFKEEFENGNTVELK